MPTQPYNVSSTLEERIKGRRAALDVLRGLPEEYQLYYKPSLRGGDAADHADPAIDYILAHKTKGLLGVVVKSGEIVEEPGGFISQYQTQKQLYKILDPVKPAELAMRALIGAFDGGSEAVYPSGVVVLFPDTDSHEFSAPKNCYLFAEDLIAVDLLSRLNDLFVRPTDSGDLAKFRANFSRLSDFLKLHSDNAALFEGDRLKQAAEAKKATPPVVPSHLRLKVAQQQGLPVAAMPLSPAPELQTVAKSAQQVQAKMRPTFKERVEKIRTKRATSKPLAGQEKAVVAAALAPPPGQTDENLALNKAAQAKSPLAAPQSELRQRASSLRAALPEASRQKDMFLWLEEVEQKGEGDAVLTTGQWLMIAGIAVVIICSVYFMARNFAIATAHS